VATSRYMLTRRTWTKAKRTVPFYGLLALFLIIVLLPIYYIFLTAFAPSEKLFTQPLSYLPQSLELTRFKTVFAGLPIGRYMLNTAVLATSSTLLALFFSFLAAYAIARMQFPGAGLVMAALLASTMLPGVTTIIPLFQMYQRLGLIDTLTGLLLLYGSVLLPVTVFVLVSFIKQVPPEVEDAAKVDGAGFWSMLFNVVLPLCRAGVATMFVINFIVGWNEFFIPLVFARGPSAKVITMALSEAQVLGSSTQYNQQWGNMAAVAIIATVPVFIITLVFQRQIVEGITSGVFK
jgi:ABC-type glycerol-3-phosphate transport system permease component